MSTQAQSSSPFARLSRIAFPFKSNSSSSGPDPQSELSPGPHNGFYEFQKDGRNTDSWGHLVSGWLLENEAHPSERRSRTRAASSASRTTGDEHRHRVPPRVHPSSGEIGDVPTPPRQRRSQEAPAHHRTSLASILSFGSKKAHKLHHSPSAGSVKIDPVPSVPQDARLVSNSHPPFPLRHPYAYAIPAVPPPPLSSPVVPPPTLKNGSTSKFSVQLLDPLARKPTAPAYLLPGRRPSKLSLKASMSTPNLRAATGTGTTLPKGKQRWLSAETWCDALILPRPRFALRVIDGEGGSGRVVSPPGSPIWPSEALPSSERPSGEQMKTLKKSHSAVQLSGRSDPPPPPRPPPPPAKNIPAAGPSNPSPPQSSPANGNTHLKPYRPKSWALDDLALPSPVPSLSQVLADGRKLEEDRKTWQNEATKSFANKQARSLSRARSKSIGARATSHVREASTFEAIAEVTLLGSQKRRPTVNVRVRPPRSDGHVTSSGGATNTGIGTFTSASHAQQSRTRSHGHSNSVGSVSQHKSEESFMWTPGHGRNHSFGRSAFKIVRTTATTAAGLCGIHGAQIDDEKGRQPRTIFNEKAAAMEEALRHDGTRVIHFQDQAAGDYGRREGDTVVVITPPLVTPSGSAANSPTVGPSGPSGVSPTPSAMSTSAEGVGIAISSPLPQDDPFEKAPIRLPGHPYAQGVTQSYYLSNPGKAGILPDALIASTDHSARSPTGTTGEGSIIRHRQIVMVHPYSPYSQVQHPFTAKTGTEPGARPKPAPLEGLFSQKSSMYAELSPGTIREIMPDEIRYSPFIPTPPLMNAISTSPGHPYGPTSKRTSEWGFADALSHTMHAGNSRDSGLGTSESHEVPARQTLSEGPTFPRLTEDVDDTIVLSPEENESPEEILDALSPRSRSESDLGLGSGRRRPRWNREATQASSNHTLASSPMESINPPVFRPELSVDEPSFVSSGSSPGATSTSSSPPHSPRPINTTEDLEKFRDLFFHPPLSRTSSEDSRPSVSRHPSGGSIPIEINARSTRSLSGLTSLARQLSVDISEVQENKGEMDEDGDPPLPMWGTRYRGWTGQRPGNVGPHTRDVLSQASSRSGSRRDGTQSPLRLPIDEDLMLSQPMDVVPEDVESSRASSMLELPLDDDFIDVRVGEVEAVSTPPVSDQPQRFSTHLVNMDYPQSEPSPMSERQSGRHVSQQSSLAAPLSSDAARSSFMTGTSGISRLSDFPAPPSHVTASHRSILNAYYADSLRSLAEDSELLRPALVREASQATFGGGQMGEAL